MCIVRLAKADFIMIIISKPILTFYKKETCSTMLTSFSLLAKVADVKSPVIHPATTHSQISGTELLDQGIGPNTIRLSIGTEYIDYMNFCAKHQSNGWCFFYALKEADAYYIPER